MPHDAATYVPSASSGVPKGTYDKVQDEVKDAQAVYAQGQRSSVAQYNTLANGQPSVATPVIKDFTPASYPADPGAAVKTIVINGTAFNATSKVLWNGGYVTVTSPTTTTLTINVPAATVPRGIPVIVENNGLFSLPKNFKFT